jgi:putative ABC transport system permease protein
MFRYIVRGVLYYRGVNAAVFLAVAVATAVIAGALIVGDSVRTSLRVMSMQRLGGITHVLHSPQFVTQELSTRVASAAGSTDESFRSVAALLMTGSVEATTESGSTRRAGSVVVLGTDALGWSMLETGAAAPPTPRGVVLGYRTAAELNVQRGDTVTLWVELPSTIPRDSLLGERDELVREIELSVDAVLAETDGASRFSLNPSQQLPHNAFVSLQTLQERLALDELVPSRRNPIARPARVNTILVGQPVAAERTVPSDSSVLETDQQRLKDLDKALQTALTLEDVGLKLRSVADRGYLSAESESMILADSLADAVIDSADRLGMVVQPVQVYLANELWAADRADDAERFSMYSIVAALNFEDRPPLGPFQLRNGEDAPQLDGHQILLSEWLATDLQVAVGDTVKMRWHEVGSDGDLPELVDQFEVRGILSGDDSASMDPDLTPLVDGVTNVDSFGEWDQPFEMEMDRITARDDDYWATYRATPKAFVSVATAKELWSSRFGTFTSVRIAADGDVLPEDRLQDLAERLKKEIPARMDPRSMGIAFQPVRLMGLQAAVGANNFAVLFLAFSSFLIMSAILLAALMFQLGIQRRVAQVGLLEAIGFTRTATRKLFLGEGLVVAVAGAGVGAAAGILCARLMILGLTTWWVGAVGTQFLLLDVHVSSLLIAAGISTGLAVLVILFALFRQIRHSPRELLTGDIEDSDGRTPSTKWTVIRRTFLCVSMVCAVGLPAASVAGRIPSGEAMGGFSYRYATFFIAGCATLAAGLLLLASVLRRRSGVTIAGADRIGLVRMAIANASRNASRSLLTTALIAFATFVIVAVAAAKRNPTSETPDRESGNGGYALVADASQPILFDLNSDEGRTRLGLDRDEATTLPAGVNVAPFGVRPGQDASCLNLFQATVPTLLGADEEFLERGGFRFADTPGDNPWVKLNEPLPDVDGLPAIPVIGDLNTLQYSLKKGLGDSILFPDADQPEYALQVVGMLDSSIFQGVLVLSDQNLKRIAPEVTGKEWFLVETANAADVEPTASALETALRVYGFDTERVSERLAGFLAVQNTYLSTFQMLGALGLLVGTVGLGAVMLRNVLERRSEIALMLAVGFTRFRITTLIIAENTMLLMWGMVTGTVSAFLAILPHLLSTGADVSWPLLGATLAAVLLFGSLAVVLPIAAATRTSIREGLAAA